jgi:hypothetical protein
MQQLKTKSCIVMMNRVTGAPVLPPSESGEFLIYNPETILLVAGNCDHRRLRTSEAGVYKVGSLGELERITEYSVMNDPWMNKKSRWPAINWIRAIVDGETQDGVYEVPQFWAVKDDNFKEVSPTFLSSKMKASMWECKPTLSYLHSQVDSVDGKDITVSQERFKLLLKSKLTGLIGARKTRLLYSNDQKANTEVGGMMNLLIQFRNLLEIVSSGIDDTTMAGFTVQFGEAFEKYKLFDAHCILTGLDALNHTTSDSQLNFKLVTGEFGGKPVSDSWITPVIQSSSLWSWSDRPSAFASDRGFCQKADQALLDKAFEG